MPKIFIYLLIIFFLSLFLVFLTAINFWLFINGSVKLIYIISVVCAFIIFFVCSYFILKINDLKKEKSSLVSFFKKNEEKIRDLEAEKNKILRAVAFNNLLEKTRADFILSVMHQLKTSVASVKWSLKMFLSHDFGKINKEQKGVAERLYKINEDMILLINSLFDVAKIEDKAYVYNKTLIDLQETIESVIVYFKDKIKNREIKLKFEKPKEKLSKIMADKEKIKAVIQNLLDNALKYTQVGGNIKISLKGYKKNIEFRIEDSGIGIPKEQQAKIFGKFFRANNANKIEATGSGLGLFLTKKIVEDHNGFIDFESEESKGSVFTFTLPIE